MRVWIGLAAASVVLALGLAVILRLQELPDATAIALITAALSAAQVLYYYWIART